MTTNSIDLDPQTIRDLVEQAKAARQFAFAPYSNIFVGAALLTIEGRVFTGCNVENSNYGATICAERTVVVKAVSEGFRKFRAIAIIADRPVPTSPCGICRQVLSQFGRDVPVIMATTLHDQVDILTVGELLPHVYISKTP